MLPLPALLALLCYFFFTGSVLANTIKDFAKPSVYQDAKISPSGELLAVKLQQKDKFLLAIYRIDSMKLISANSLRDDLEVGNFHWATNNRLVIEPLRRLAGEEKLKSFGELYAINVDGSKSGLIYGFYANQQSIRSVIKRRTNQYAFAKVIDTLPNDKKHILIASTPMEGVEGSSLKDGDFSVANLTYTGAKRANILKLNIFNGRLKKVTKSPIANAVFTTNNQGELTFAVGEDNLGKRKVFQINSEKKWSQVQHFNYGDAFQIISHDDSGDYLFALNNLQDKIGLEKIHLQSGKSISIYRNNTVDITSLEFNPHNNIIYALRIDIDYPSFISINKDSVEAQIFTKLLAQFPHKIVDIINTDTKTNLWLTKVSSPQQPPKYYLYNNEKNTLNLLFSTHRQVVAKQLNPVSAISFSSQDKSVINGYLTLTNNKKKSNRALVVMLHDGPEKRDYWQYDAQIQMLAQQGYNVLQINYRGSHGYGKKFRQAGNHKWGSDIQQDIINGTRWAIKQGYANKDKICIMGAGFGAYSALQSAVLAPNLYQCIIANNGFYDLSLLSDYGFYSDWYQGNSYLTNVVGTNHTLLNQFSPSKNVNNLSAPVFIAHGGKNSYSPIIHAEQLRSALDKSNKNYTWFVKGREAESFNHNTNQLEYFEQISQFLAKHLQ